ncbi:MAG: oligosaccharide flippase family protein, partial [Candidatus Sumerlaeota bacterium]|nr:oligosaccharide flippase family protein [Candidatus Sumerlaeota bacterium]
VAGNVGARALALAAAVVAARLLGKETFGRLGMVQSTMGLFGVAAGFGLGLTATKHVAELRRRDPERAGRVIALAGAVSLFSAAAMALVCAAAAPWLAAHTLAAPRLADPLRAAALLLFVSALLAAQTGALIGFEAFRSIAWVNAAQGVIALPATFLLVRWYDLQGAIAAQTLAASVGLLMASLALGRECRAHGIGVAVGRSAFAEARILWSFSLPTMASGAMAGPAIWAANAILVNQPGGYSQMGLFNVASQWRGVLLFLPMTIGAVALPLMADAHGRGDPARYARAVRANLRAIWAVGLPLSVLGIGASGWLARLYGAQYVDARFAVAILLCATFLTVVNRTVGQALASSSRMWTGAAMNAAWAATLLLSSSLLAPRMGALGLASAYLAAYIVHAILVMWYVETRLARGTLQGAARGAAASLALLAASFVPAAMGLSAAGVVLLVALTAAAGWTALRSMPSGMLQRLISSRGGLS